MTAHFPAWLHALAVTSVALGIIAALIISIDEIARPQKMWIMALVWPLCALFGSVLWLAFYFAYGRSVSHPRSGAKHGEHDMGPKPPFPVLVAKGASHCGAG